jgi:hypothetical protein
MTDDPRNPGEPRLPRESGDARDERLAARLQTAPLDDVTRARLVRNAMAASGLEATPHASRARPSSAPVRWLAVAAVVVVLLAVGVAVLARNDSGSSPTAARAPKADAPQSRRAEPPSAPLERSQLDQGFSASGVQSLGNLGDVGKKAELRRAVADVLSPQESPAAAAAQAAQAAPTANGAQTDARSSTVCAGVELARLGRTIAVGTGTVGGAPVTVYVVERSNGDRVAVVVDAACTVGAPVGL